MGCGLVPFEVSRMMLLGLVLSWELCSVTNGIPMLVRYSTLGLFDQIGDVLGPAFICGNLSEKR